MKVNPIGVQSYQQLNRQEQQKAPVAQQKTDNAENKKVLIEPQNKLTKSAVSVKAPKGSYDKYMTDKYMRVCKLIGGTVLVALGIIMLFFPEYLR